MDQKTMRALISLVVRLRIKLKRQHGLPLDAEERYFDFLDFDGAEERDRACIQAYLDRYGLAFSQVVQPHLDRTRDRVAQIIASAKSQHSKSRH